MGKEEVRARDSGRTPSLTIRIGVGDLALSKATSKLSTVCVGSGRWESGGRVTSGTAIHGSVLRGNRLQVGTRGFQRAHALNQLLSAIYHENADRVFRVGGQPRGKLVGSSISGGCLDPCLHKTCQHLDHCLIVAKRFGVIIRRLERSPRDLDKGCGLSWALFLDTTEEQVGQLIELGTHVGLADYAVWRARRDYGGCFQGQHIVILELELIVVKVERGLCHTCESQNEGQGYQSRKAARHFACLFLCYTLFSGKCSKCYL
mmetsp:Transcript_15611/g.27405  ORF Transcript_15611/g.27405 Transcript_15611/m.27405 type:complete len:261 (+) Transcript_15611:485-1267(+)